MNVLDRILNLHYHYAVALTTSPLLMPGKWNTESTQISPSRVAFPVAPPQTASSDSGGKNRWDEMVSDQTGFDMLVRGRDSAIDFIRAVCSVCLFSPI